VLAIDWVGLRHESAAPEDQCAAQGHEFVTPWRESAAYEDESAADAYECAALCHESVTLWRESAAQWRDCVTRWRACAALEPAGSAPIGVCGHNKRGGTQSMPSRRQFSFSRANSIATLAGPRRVEPKRSFRLESDHHICLARMLARI
jgi:hypothetical protein